MKSPLLCVRCRHYRAVVYGGGKGTTFHECIKYARVEPVTGVGLVGVVSCGEARELDTLCGYWGMQWEAKDE